MELVNSELTSKYKRVMDEIKNEYSLLNECVISITDVLNAHFSIADYFLENSKAVKSVKRFEIRDEKLLSTVVESQKDKNHSKVECKNHFKHCATLFYGLIKHHPFHDCNKRTALLTLLYYLVKINRAPTASHKELEIITLIIASNTIRDRKAFKPFSDFEDGEIRFLAQYLQKNTKPIDIRSYLITYNELNKILVNFGFYLNNPLGNSIEIIRIETQLSLFGLLKKKHTKVGVIGFSGWTKEVPRKEMKLLKGYTGLSDKKNFDSQIDNNGVPSLSSLINYYSETFKNLERKVI